LHLAIYTFKLLFLRRFGLWLAGAVGLLIWLDSKTNN